MVGQSMKIIVATLLAGVFGQVGATEWGLVGTSSTVFVNGLNSINAYANTDNGNPASTGTSTSYVNNAASQTIEAATWSGQTTSYGGVKNNDACVSGTYCDVNDGNSPEHAIDNNQRYEMVMLNFDTKVNLTSLKLSWYSFDNDFTVLAYTGSGTKEEAAAGAGLVGKTYSTLAGWTVIGSYNATTGESTVVGGVNNNGFGYSKSFSNSVYSSSWLIGAYNPLVGASANDEAGLDKGSGSRNDLNNGYDYIKLASVTGTACSGAQCGGSSVPEPNALMLLGLGLLGVIRMRKAKTS